MADETTISTPVETASVDTSSNVEPAKTKTVDTADTSTEEPTSKVDTAETGTQEKLYAGKYKSVEELEKGYQESQKAFNEAADLRKQLGAITNAQKEQENKANLERLEQAQQRGFDSVEAQEIADKVQVAEFEFYANNIGIIHPEQMEAVRSNLLQYYQTANKAYLDEAKRYFPSDFIEKAALQKSMLENQLKSSFKDRQSQQLAENEKKLAETINTDFADFLSDMNANQGKQEALKSFCAVGSIKSKEDMQMFQDIYSKIAEYERGEAIKEYEAKKAIDETKGKAQIDGNPTNINGTELPPTYEQISKMSQAQYNAAVDKWGLSKILQAN